jgi:diguanylate cyclase (GGDEF)-like protein
VGDRGHVCRFGGDEFIGYLPGSGIEAAEEIAEAIRASVESHEFTREGVTVAPTISIGVAERTREVRNAEELTRLADDALYRAKRAGRNCVSR